MIQPNSGMLHSGDANLFYVDYPAPFPGAQTIVFLHGNGEDHRYFSEQIAYFRDRYRLVLMDSRGHGKSEFGSRGLDFSIFSEDLCRLMDFLDIPSAHLLGFSDGGNLALTFALHHPQRVQSLILNGANLKPSGMKPGVLLAVLMEYGWCKVASIWSQNQRKKLEILGLMVHHPHIEPKQLEALPMPALVIVGEQDMIRHRHSRMIADSLPNADFVCLKGADHFCAAKVPEAFCRATEEFLSKLS